MAKEEKQSEGFYKDNVVEITINGQKHFVNKYEADELQKKLAKNSKNKASKSDNQHINQRTNKTNPHVLSKELKTQLHKHQIKRFHYALIHTNALIHTKTHH